MCDLYAADDERSRRALQQSQVPAKATSGPGCLPVERHRQSVTSTIPIYTAPMLEVALRIAW